MSVFKYVNKSDSPLTVSTHVFAASGFLNYESTQAELDVLDGISVDRYVDGVPTTVEYTKYGVSNAGSVLAGQVGEFVTSDISGTAAVSLTSATAANVTSLALTAGDWEVRGSYAVVGAASTSFTAATGGINTTTATLPAVNKQDAHVSAALVPGGTYVAAAVPSVRINVNGATTVYLVADATFTVSTATVVGVLSARRTC